MAPREGSAKGGMLWWANEGTIYTLCLGNLLGGLAKEDEMEKEGIEKKKDGLQEKLELKVLNT